MISITRPAQPPARLADRGPAAIATLCAEFDASPDDYLDGTKKFEFDSDIYGHASIKAGLKTAQHDKCCFCESKVPHVAHGDVEHFRPKAGYKQRSEDDLGRPGYYWLAYEWSNLLFSCQICNQTHKKNLYPLLNPTSRARSHHDDIGRERPLLIDPAVEDPTRWVGFRQEVAYPIRRSRRGKKTIEIAGLNRPDLVEQRRALLVQVNVVVGLLDGLRSLSQSSQPTGDAADPAALIAQMESTLRAMREPDREYSAMVHAALRGVMPD